MPATMAPEKRKPKPDAPKPAEPKTADVKPTGNRHVEPRESFHLPQAMLDALVRYVERTKPATTKSAVIRLALEEFLARQGLWEGASDA